MNKNNKKNIKTSVFKLIICFFYILIIFRSNAFTETLRIGLSLNQYDALKLEKKLNAELSKTALPGIYDSIKVIPIGSYEKKRNAILNNEVDIIDVGFGLFYEANKNHTFKVILHACYLTNYEDMFYISGKIFCNKNDNFKIEDITGRKVFAVEHDSCSGYDLQKIYLENKKIEFSTPIFIKNHEMIPLYVKNNPGSIGFCGSFIKLNPDDFKTLYTSEKVPGNIVIAKTSINSVILDEATKIIMDGYNQIFSTNSKINKIMVYPLKDNYFDYLDYYKYEEVSQNTKALLIATVIILILSLTLIIVVLKNKSNNKKFRMSFIKKSGYEYVYKDIVSFNFRDINYWWKPLEKAFSNCASQNYQTAIFDITSHFEDIAKDLIKEIEKLDLAPHWDIPRGNNMLKNIIQSINTIIDKLRSKMSKSQNCKNTEQAYTDVLAGDELKLLPLATLDGLFTELYAYRNFSAHHHFMFCREEDARNIIDTYIKFINKIGESQFFK